MQLNFLEPWDKGKPLYQVCLVSFTNVSMWFCLIHNQSKSIQYILYCKTSIDYIKDEGGLGDFLL